MLDQRGQGAVGGGRCGEDAASASAGASFLGERAAARGWPGIQSAGGRVGTEALCGGLSHLFPSDGSEARSAEDSVLIPLAPPSCAALRGGARELQRPEAARVCSSAGVFSAQMFPRVCLFFKAPGGPSGPTIFPHDVGRGGVCVEHARSCLTNNRRWKSAGFRERRSSPVFPAFSRHLTRGGAEPGPRLAGRTCSPAGPRVRGQGPAETCCSCIPDQGHRARMWTRSPSPAAPVT